jgi:hypothetical protein
MKTGPKARMGSMMGTATRRMAPHQYCSTSQPPKIGPSAAPPEKPAAQMAMASRRRLGSGKMLRIRERVDGISIAPKSPRAARPAMSHSALGAKAVAADTAANPVLPIRRSRRRPIRSPKLPIATRSPARTSG